MRRLFAVGLALVVLVLGSACTGDDRDVDTPDPLQQKAASLTDLVAANDWEAVRADFDATMLASLSEAQLESAWQQVTQQVGSYESRGEPTPVPKPGDLLVFDTPMQFERGAMKSRVTLRPDGQVAGLFILLPDVP